MDAPLFAYVVTAIRFYHRPVRGDQVRDCRIVVAADFSACVSAAAGLFDADAEIVSVVRLGGCA